MELRRKGFSTVSVVFKKVKFESSLASQEGIGHVAPTYAFNQSL
ncbi:hypothetical protein ADIAL_1941 [Alkalibacterium sp. AK22]|nr:hypothetical protein ADIAL_1941 [Alkalibacterium sp. AK22]